MSGDPRQEQAFVQQLKAAGNPQATAQANQLQTLYHDQQMAALAADVYQSAEHKGQPPTGWIRASEHPEALASQGFNAKELEQKLAPNGSGFRAEVYLPDPKILGPGYEPVLAFKGSANSVMTANGLRDTTAEDFLANNFPQSVGLETDYYDRAMSLAVDLQRGGLKYELTGHSLAGGMASAASAVTGNHATTWNAAGLHPVTAERYAQQNPGIAVHDVSHLVKSYQVQGELLNAGIQDNIHGLSWIQRNELGNVLQETSQVLNQNPAGRELLKKTLDKQVPVEAQASVHAFVDKIADGDTNKMLRELPLAAGQVQPLLAPMMPADANGQVLVARKQQMGLPELTYLAGPALEVANATAVGARAGHAAGEFVAHAGQVSQRALHAASNDAAHLGERGGQAAQTVTEFGGRVVQAGEHAVGATMAEGRVLAGEAQATLAAGTGYVLHKTASTEADALRGASDLLGSHAPTWLRAAADKLDHVGDATLQQSQAAAAVARHDAQSGAANIRAGTQAAQAHTATLAGQVGAVEHRVLAGAGNVVSHGLNDLGDGAVKVTRGAPEVGRMAGAAIGFGSSTAAELQPANAGRLVGLAVAASQAKAAGTEALDRHGMTTVLPSLEHRVENLERQARQTLQTAHAQQHAATQPAPAPTLADPSHAGHAMYQQALAGVQKIDAQMGRVSDQQSHQLAGALTASAKAQGMTQIHQVSLSDNGAKAYAIEHVIPNALTRDAEVSTTQAVQQPLAQSTATWDQANLAQQAQAQSQAQQHLSPPTPGMGR